MTATYGILGWPVEHSRSPAMHNAAFRAKGLDCVYVRFPVHPDDVASAVRGLRALGVRGANVTVPHKEAVIPHLDEVTREARAIGAVNTIVREHDRLIGHNTDASGLSRALAEAQVKLEGARIVVLGAGGAARAAVVGLANQGASHIAIAARRPGQAAALAAELGDVCACPLSAGSLEREALASAFEEATLVVQSTSATLATAPDAAAFAAALPLEALRGDAAVVDLVYKPRETTVLARARAHGLSGIDGLGMLLHQGALAFELWTHLHAPLPVMRAVLEAP
jgi:shikimate dehydrogenase